MAVPTATRHLIRYHPGMGTGWTDSSSRIQKIEDVRARYTTYYNGGIVSYVFRYDAVPYGQTPRLVEIWNNVGSGEGYSFDYISQNLNSPFAPFTSFGATKLLAGIHTPVGVYQFQYDGTGAGELIRITLQPIRTIGVDEIQYAKGHKYLTLVYQIDLALNSVGEHPYLRPKTLAKYWLDENPQACETSVMDSFVRSRRSLPASSRRQWLR